MTAILIFNGFFKNIISVKQSFSIAVIASLIIGVLWEYFELHFQITFLSDGWNYWTDTSSDVFLDVLGGFLAAKYSFYILDKYGK